MSYFLEEFMSYSLEEFNKIDVSYKHIGKS